MLESVAAETPKNFDLAAAGKGWSEKLQAEGLETKGRGRPAKSGGSGATRSAAEPELNFSSKELAPLVKALANPACRSGGVDVLSDTEVTELSDALAPVLTKYFGATINRWGVEVAFVGVALKVGAPRVIQAVENRKKSAGSETESSAPESGGPIPSKQSKDF